MKVPDPRQIALSLLKTAGVERCTKPGSKARCFQTAVPPNFLPLMGLSLNPQIRWWLSSSLLSQPDSASP
ncbi:hypothetical protein SynBMKMC1_01625 [Synechococcus sp. BMK-MC-1]|nr:hypothetical protein SynBMKMC1_01625 [Synechococcus sp. BMK-MC-1]